MINDYPINKITPYEKNAKEHPKNQIAKIAASIQQFGFNQPIVIDKEGVIIVGHGRYEAALLLKLTAVPVLQLDLPEEQVKSYRLADNKLNETKWDMDLVVEELKTMSLEMINLSGFDSNLTLETKEDKPDLGEPGVPRSKVGDIYELGSHKLICGDSEDPKIYKKLLGEEKARLIFTDPPYSINYESMARVFNVPSTTYSSEKFGGTGGKIFNDNKTPAEALEWYTSILKQMHDFSSDDVTIYWWFATRLADINMEAMRNSKWHISQTVVWLKNQLLFSPSQLFHRIYEPCMVGWKEGESPYQNRTFCKFTELWTLNKKKFADYLDLWYQKRDATNKYIHPTQKPVQLAERAIKRSSEKGDIVLDAFGGSGSTMIACDQLGRKCRMIELDPKYVDAIVTRYTQFKEDGNIRKNGEKILW